MALIATQNIVIAGTEPTFLPAAAGATCTHGCERSTGTESAPVAAVGPSSHATQSAATAMYARPISRRVHMAVDRARNTARERECAVGFTHIR